MASWGVPFAGQFFASLGPVLITGMAPFFDSNPRAGPSCACECVPEVKKGSAKSMVKQVHELLFRAGKPGFARKLLQARAKALAVKGAPPDASLEAPQEPPVGPAQGPALEAPEHEPVQEEEHGLFKVGSLVRVAFEDAGFKLVLEWCRSRTAHWSSRKQSPPESQSGRSDRRSCRTCRDSTKLKL